MLNLRTLLTFKGPRFRLVHRLARATRLAGTLLASQGIVLVTNAAAGLMLANFLSVDQYALFTLASTLLVFFSLAANPGIAQAIITQAARVDEQSAGQIISAAVRVSRKLYIAILPLLLLLSAVVLRDWPVTVIVVIAITITVTAWVRAVTGFRGAILFTRHDVQALFQIGIGDGLLRIGLIPLCYLWPSAALALVIGLAGASLARVLSGRVLGIEQLAGAPAFTGAIWAFVVPLIPLSVYSALQGQIAVLALSLFGSNASIAEYGALTRLGQLVALFVLLNPLLVQPVMARQHHRAGFVWHLNLVLGGLTAFSILVMSSVFEAPDWWLFVLGDNYAGLQNELPLAVGAALLSLIGVTLYAVVISRNCTSGQAWVVVLSLVGQLSFLGIHGLRTVSDGLVLGVIAAASLVIVELLLIAQLLRNWDTSSLGTQSPHSIHQEHQREDGLILPHASLPEADLRAKNLTEKQQFWSHV